MHYRTSIPQKEAPQRASRPLVRLGEVAQIASGYAAREAVQASEHGTHFLLQVSDFDESRTRVHLPGLVRIHPSGSSWTRPLTEGDVLFLAKGRNPFGYAVRDLPSPTFASAPFFVLRPAPELLPEYLAWFLSQEPTKQHLSAQSGSNVNMPVIRRAVLENLQVPLPTLDDQHRIAELARLAAEEAALMDRLKTLRTRLIASCVFEPLPPSKETAHE